MGGFYEEDYSETPRKKKKGFIFVVLLFILAGGVLCYDYGVGGGKIVTVISDTFSKLTASSSQRNAKKNTVIVTDGRSAFRTFGRNFMECTKDGVKYYSADGNQMWNDTFTMTSPVIVGEGDITAVAELLGRTIRVYNQKGLMYTVQTQDPVVQMAVNADGYLAFIYKENEDYGSMVYTNAGTQVQDRKDQDAGQYPISLDVSDDNRILAVSYLDTTDIQLKSKVLFFYLNKSEGQNFSDALFAAVEKEDEIIPVLSFMKDNMLAAVSDKSVTLLGSDGLELWNIPIKNKIDQAYLGSKEYIVLGNGEEMAGEDGVADGTVQWINLEGKIAAEYFVKGGITYLNGSQNAIVVGSNRDFYALTNSGREIWNHKAVQDIQDILFMENHNTVLYVTKNSAEIKNIDTLVDPIDEAAESEEAAKKENTSAETDSQNTEAAGDEGNTEPSVPEEAAPEEKTQE